MTGICFRRGAALPERVPVVRSVAVSSLFLCHYLLPCVYSGTNPLIPASCAVNETLWALWCGEGLTEPRMATHQPPAHLHAAPHAALHAAPHAAPHTPDPSTDSFLCCSSSEEAFSAQHQSLKDEKESLATLQKECTAKRYVRVPHWARVPRPPRVPRSALCAQIPEEPWK